MKKGAIELSMSFIVMTILALIVFFTIISLNTRIFSQTKGMQEDLDQQTEKEIMNIFKISSSNFVVPFRVLEVSPGDNAVFGVGIRNDINISGISSFTIKVSTPEIDVVGFRMDKTNISRNDVDTNNWLFSSGEYGPFIINTNSFETFPIVISVPKDDVIKGQYIFEFEVETTPFNVNNNQDYYKSIYVYVRVV